MEEESKMKALILFTGITGNTKKVADAIADATGIECRKLNRGDDLTPSELGSYDLIFLGGGIYAFKIHAKLKRFAENLDPGFRTRFALFFTHAAPIGVDKPAIDGLIEMFREKQQIIEDDFFDCYGRFTVTRLGHPNKEELERAAAWAKRIAKV